MNKLPVAIAAIAVILAVSLGFYFWLDYEQEQFENQVEIIEQSAAKGDALTTFEELTRLDEQFEKTTFWLTISISHREINQISTQIKVLKELAYNKDTTLFLSECARLKQYMFTLKGVHAVNAGNIL